MKTANGSCENPPGSQVSPVRPWCRFRLFLCLALLSGTPALVRAEVHGGIEIGAKGIRAIAVDVAKDGAAKILLIENKNTTLVADLAAKKQFSAAALAETEEIVKQFARKIQVDYKVPNERIYIVGSSGLFAALDGDENLVKVNRELLVQHIHNATGIKMDFVSAGREAELTITSVVPANHRYEAVLLDIGSGNTKGGADDKKSGLTTFAIPFGTVTFADQVKKAVEKDSFAETASSLRKRIVSLKLKEVLAGKPDLATRNRVYLSGGSVWALTTLMKPAERGPFVSLSPEDIESFYQFLLKHPKDLPNPDLSRIDNEETRKSAAKDLDQVRATFSRDQLIAGVEILKALSDAFQLDGKEKQIVFARNAYIGWILGYTIEKGMGSK
jgi:exopolyphosphatase/pppGpp-phosphohydrolase